MPQTCYRHPDRETAVSCSSCGRPICPDCMTPTPVGMRCPECANQRTRVVRNPTGTPSGFGAFPATVVLIAINVIVYLIEIAKGGGGLGEQSVSIVYDMGGLWGPAVSEGGQWWRIITSGFVHVSIFHIGFNMYLLFILGRLLEPAIGSAALRRSSTSPALLAGSFVALCSARTRSARAPRGRSSASSAPPSSSPAGGGSTRSPGRSASSSCFNLIFTFSDGSISVGAHVGGLVAGVLCGLLIVGGERGKLGAVATRNRARVRARRDGGARRRLASSWPWPLPSAGAAG